MQLKSELRPSRVGGHWLSYNDGDLQHDAMAAHAMRRAMEEIADELGDTVLDWQLCIDRIELRAAEIFETRNGAEVQS